jgi:hypothetical protein
MQHRWHAEIVDWRDGSVFAVTIDYRQCWADAHGHASDIITDIRWPIAV